MNQNQASDRNQAGFPMCNFLQGHKFNGTQTTPATQTPLFVQCLPGVKQENDGHFMQNYAQQPPAEPPGPNIGVLDWAQQYGSTGDLAVWTLDQSTSSLPQGGAGDDAHASMQEAFEEQQLRRINNRQAAKRYRQKKKEYIKCLECHAALLENQNRSLMEELRVLKDVYRVEAK